MPTADSIQRHRSSDRRWIILVGAFITFALSASIMHAYTVFLVAFVETFH
jgi:hypothetical protein